MVLPIEFPLSWADSVQQVWGKNSCSNTRVGRLSAASWRQRRQYSLHHQTLAQLWAVNKKQLLKNIFTMDQSREERIKVAYGGWYLSASHKNYLDAALSWEKSFWIMQCEGLVVWCGNVFLLILFWCWMKSQHEWRMKKSHSSTSSRHSSFLQNFIFIQRFVEVWCWRFQRLFIVPRISEIQGVSYLYTPA